MFRVVLHAGVAIHHQLNRAKNAYDGSEPAGPDRHMDLGHANSSKQLIIRLIIKVEVDDRSKSWLMCFVWFYIQV